MSTAAYPISSPTQLPAWLTHRTRNVGYLSSPRLRLLVIATCCVLIGYLFTSSFNAPAAISEAERTPGSPNGYDSTQDKSAKSGAAGLLHAKLSSLHAQLSNEISDKLGWNSRPPTSCPESCRSASTGVYTSYDTYNLSSPPKVSESISQPNADRLQLGEKPRIGKVSMIFGDGNPVYERAIRTHELHDRIHGYRLYTLRHSMLDDVWSKPAYILHLLLRELSKPQEERLHWLFWADADTILLNPQIPLEIFLPPSPDFDDVNIVLTEDHQGLNNGVFPVRVTQWSVDLFTAIVAYRHFKPNDELTFRDQTAMSNLIATSPFVERVAFVPQRWFNAYQGGRDGSTREFEARRGDLLVHFAGVSDRTEAMTYWCEKAEQHLPDWELDVVKTSYPRETREYWSEAKRNRTESRRIIDDNKLAILRIEEPLDAYGARLDGNVRRVIDQKKEALRRLVDGDRKTVDAGPIAAARAALNQVCVGHLNQGFSFRKYLGKITRGMKLICHNRQQNRSRKSFREKKPRCSRRPTMRSPRPDSSWLWPPLCMRGKNIPISRRPSTHLRPWSRARTMDMIS